MDIKSAMTPGELRLLVDLGWLRAVRATADGQVTEYALTNTGKAALARQEQNDDTQRA